ncbi:MAG TPA: hypothetical protein VGD37_26545 [Kofleriaceae bacterium]
MYCSLHKIDVIAEDGLHVQDGEIIGLARVGDPPADPAAPAKKPGWLRRVFGRN